MMSAVVDSHHMNKEFKGLTMDRRTQERTPLIREVLLYCHSFGLIRGMTKDISSAGVFVFTPGLSLDTHSHVDVCFLQKGQKTNSFHKINAKVTRVNGAGIGLSFINPLPAELLVQIH